MKSQPEGQNEPKGRMPHFLRMMTHGKRSSTSHHGCMFHLREKRRKNEEPGKTLKEKCNTNTYKDSYAYRLFRSKHNFLKKYRKRKENKSKSSLPLNHMVVTSDSSSEGETYYDALDSLDEPNENEVDTQMDAHRKS
ncbi:hypothetical protein SUGI_0255340 [Cryptomeria japonica]|nr:hypothetical protein SUGI_0255340 [Cryptomeria japonica]